MENLFLLVHMAVVGAAIVIVMLLIMNSDEKLPRNFVKIRVRVDGSRRTRVPEPQQDEEYDTQTEFRWLFVAFLLALILLYLNL
jgi:hypothetical protein